MEISALTVFLEVMRHLSFTEVANARGIAPSSVSRSIASLEKELGLRLFQRSTRKLAPTEAGLLYFERISPLLEALQSAHQMAADIDEAPRGVLRVSAAVVFGEQHIVPLLPELAEQYPLLDIELILSDSYLDLIDQRIDVAIRLGSLNDSSLIAHRLAKINFFVVASPRYITKQGDPDSPKQLLEHNCLLFPRMDYSLNWVFKNTAGVLDDIPIKGRYLITHSHAIKTCTLAGMGISLLPDWLVSREIKEGRLIRLFSKYDVTATDYKSSVWLVYPSREYLPLKVRVFNEYIKANLLVNNE
ncbi:MAG: LysR family transcriptional regulator [Ectothiorhodospiraceae bacterium]|nr:LysR family transcriptional regulator [Ectothiorhodospiraceae bacterium]